MLNQGKISQIDQKSPEERTKSPLKNPQQTKTSRCAAVKIDKNLIIKNGCNATFSCYEETLLACRSRRFWSWRISHFLDSGILQLFNKTTNTLRGEATDRNARGGSALGSMKKVRFQPIYVVLVFLKQRLR